MGTRGLRRALTSASGGTAPRAASAPPTSAAETDRPTVSPAPTAATRTRLQNEMAAAHTHSAPSDRRSEGRAGSRRIFPPQFKLQVLEAYRRDTQCRGNQRATARKFGIHRRQIQKWLQAEPALRAALLRRAPQPAPSPPPYAAGSPESARLPSPPPAALPTSIQVPTSVQLTAAGQVPTPIQVSTTIQMLTPVQLSSPVQKPTPLPVTCITPPVVINEPIDLSVRRPSPPPLMQPAYVNSSPSEPPRKEFKLFRPYLLEDDERRRAPLSMSVGVCEGPRVSAFVPVGCALAACPAPHWGSPVPSFPAPLR